MPPALNTHTHTHTNGGFNQNTIQLCSITKRVVNAHDMRHAGTAGFVTADVFTFSGGRLLCK